MPDPTPPRTAAWRDCAAYAIGLAVGLAAVAGLLSPAVIAGTGGMWRWPGGDLAQNLTGHLAVQAPGWHWPPLLAPGLAWPHGLSVAMTDSNPLVSLLAKLVAGAAGHPVNLMGAWLAACWLLQPVAAVFAVRGFGAGRSAPGRGPGARGWEAALAAAVLAVTFPALLARYGHINLLGHFTLLLALGLALRLTTRPTAWRWWAAGVVLLVAVLIHPYLFVFALALLAAPVLQGLAGRRPGAWRGLVALLLAAGASVAAYKLLSGTLGAGDRGFGVYSMNLLSPIWPQRSGLFGADLPMMDGTGGQYEGFSYLGAGGLLLVLAALALGLRQGLRWRRWWGLAAVLVGLTLLALTPRVYAGHMLVVPLGVRPWDQVFALVRASGRAFWPVGYTLLLGATAVLSARLPRPWLGVALGAALVLQWLDTAPLRREARAYYAGDAQAPPAVALPKGAGLVSVVPLCLPWGKPAYEGDLIRLSAVRDGARLGSMRASRLPAWFNCETDATDGLETTLRPGELRVFVDAAHLPLRQAALGPGTECRSQPGYTLCGLGLEIEGAPAPPGPALPMAAAPALLEGAALRAALSAGWVADEAGRFWSEGPRATLLFRPEGVAPGAGLVLRLRLAGVARSGGARPVRIGVNGGAAVAVDLPDLGETVVELAVPSDDVAERAVRVTFDIFRPVDPAARELDAPVRRAGVILRGVEISKGRR